MSKVFVSYSSKDRGFVEQLVRDLHANGIQLWYDQWEMLPGDLLTDKIGTAIMDNDFFIVVLTRNSVASEWVRRELGVALQREFQERRVRVVPLLAEKCDIPAFLSNKVYADFTSGYREGLASLLKVLLDERLLTKPIKTTMPSDPRVVWDNVVADNIVDSNIAR